MGRSTKLVGEGDDYLVEGEEKEKGDALMDRRWCKLARSNKERER